MVNPSRRARTEDIKALASARADRDEVVNVQEYQRPDGTTKRIEEETVVDGETVATRVTNFAPVIEEAD